MGSGWAVEREVYLLEVGAHCCGEGKGTTKETDGLGGINNFNCSETLYTRSEGTATFSTWVDNRT